MDSLIRNNIEKTLDQEISDGAFARFMELSFEKSFEKKQILVREGALCKYQYLILEGACYSYYINDKGERNAVQFAVENYWITDPSGYFSRKPANFNIEAIESGKGLMLHRDRFDQLCKEYVIFDRFFRILLQNTLANLHYRIAKTNSEEAEHRYLEFSRLYPHFVQRIPQYLIASYLGIKPQSLSRIRKALAGR